MRARRCLELGGWLVAAGLIAVVSAWAGPAGATETGRAAAALDLCSAASASSGARRAALVDQGLALAEEAVRADAYSARAHLAVFCNLGRQMELSRNPFTSLLRLARLRREVDTALDLDPTSAGALAGKGALLRALPRLLGGDRDEAERLLRRALAEDPDQLDARLNLALALRDRAALDEARAEAGRVVALAEARGDRAAAGEAEDLLRSLGR
ncbi:MAG: hypothetical protein U0807_13700 [Candidatus Binatia bacterium]